MIYLPPIPPQYDRPFIGETVKFSMPLADIRKVCRVGEYGCSYLLGNTCGMILPRVGKGGVAPRTLEAIIRHENTHCVAAQLGQRWEHR